MQNSNYSKKYWKTFLNIFLFISLLFILFFQLQKSSFQVQDFNSFLHRMDLVSVILLLIAFILAFINWETESLEWRTMVNSIQKVTLQNSRITVLSAHAIGLLTPYRIGELAARTYLTKSDDKGSLLSYSITGAAAQWLVISLMGIPGIIIVTPGPSISLIYLYPILMILGTLIYFNLDKIPFPKRFAKYAPQSLSFSIKYKVLFLTIIRYLIFSTQFILLIKAFGVHGGWEILFLGVSSVFLIQSLFPLPPWADLGVRGNASVFVFTQLYINPAPVLMASLSLWLINIFIPAIIGWYWLRQNFETKD